MYPQFDYCLGGGGCISQMRYIPDNYNALLAPALGNDTDRVMQYTFWGVSTNCIDPNSKEDDKRFNVDQAGNKTGIFSPVFSVSSKDNNIDIYSVAHNQWYSSMDADFTGSVSSFTRYSLEENGVLQVRKVILVPDILLSGKSVGAYDLYFEQWLPFRFSSDAFDSLAFGLNMDGEPNWWYSNQDGTPPENRIPYYLNKPTSATNGLCNGI